MKYPRWLVVPAVLTRLRPLQIAVLLSVALHLLVLLALVVPLGLKQNPVPKDQGTIELLMVEQKGAEPGAPAQQPQPKSQPPSASPKTDAAASPPPAPPVPPSNKPAEIAAAPPPPQPTPAKPAAAPPPSPAQPTETPPAPAQAAAQKAPVFNLQGTDSDSNAVALGGHILPAQPDDRFRNRPPVYPIEAQAQGQHGTVVVVIHVGDNGLAKGVDVVESSGVRVLDQAAVTAVRKWRFRPAMQDGRTIPFDMPFRFVFESN